MNKIKIFQFYFYPDISAVSQLLGELLHKTAEDPDIDITVYCGKSAYTGNKTRGKLPDKLGNVKIKRIHTPSLGRKSIIVRLIEYSSFYLSVFFISLFSPNKTTLISMTSPPMIALFAALGVLFRKNRFIYYVEDLFPETLYDMGYVKDPVKIRKLEKLNRIIFKRADNVITLGKKMTGKISGKYSISSEKISEIPNWYSEKGTFAPLNKSGKDFKLFYSGNMGIAHDFTLLEMLVKELKNDKNLCYEFSGEGNRKKEVESIFSLCGENRVDITGYRDNSEHFQALKDADILIAAQKKETVGDILPSKIYSYLAAGCPVLFLGPLDSEIADIILSNDIGIIAELEEDVFKAAEYIRYLKKYPDIREKTGLRARFLYESRYTLSESVNKFERILNKV